MARAQINTPVRQYGEAALAASVGELQIFLYFYLFYAEIRRCQKPSTALSCAWW